MKYEKVRQSAVELVLQMERVCAVVGGGEVKAD